MPGWRKVLRYLAVAALAGLALWQLDVSQFLAAFDLRMLLAIVAAQIPMMVVVGVSARRHAMLVRVPPVAFRPSLEALVLANALNLVIPGRLSELVKATYLRATDAIPVLRSIMAIVVQKMMDLVVVGAVATAAIAGTVYFDPTYFAIVPIAALLALVLMRPVATFVERRLDNIENRMAAFVREQCGYVRVALSDGRGWSAAALTMTMALAHITAVTTFLHLQPELPSSLPVVLLVYAGMLFGGALPLLPAGVGTFEAAIIFVLTRHGVAFDEALAAAIGLHVTEVLIGAVAGPFLLATRSTGVRGLMAEALAAARTLRTNRDAAGGGEASPR